MTLRVDRYALALAVALPVLGGCRTYTERTSDALRDFRAGNFDAAARVFADEDVTGSAFLSGAEAGLAALTGGDFAAARDHLTRGVEAVRAIEDEALVSPENAGQTFIGWVVNDTWSDYLGEGYERVMLHACLGLAYLGLGEVEDVLVEVRRANALLDAEEQLYSTEYRAGGLGHFLSAVGYEQIGQLDEAYIDYKRLHEKGLGGALVGRSLARLARDLGRQEDLARWEDEFGPGADVPADAARVILVAGVGMGPQKAEARLNIPTRDGLLVWTVPQFVHGGEPVPLLELAAGSTVVSTVVLEDVGAVAQKNLSDRLAWLATKSAVRAVLKRELTKSLEEEHGPLGFLVGTLYTLASERADLRSWTTLPDTWQAARLFVDPGVVGLRLRAVGAGACDLGTFELEPGETLYVLARTIGPRLFAHTVGGRPVDATPTEAGGRRPAAGPLTQPLGD
jgi:hypothetical protein